MPGRSPIPVDWPSLPDEQLLDLRLCDLPITIEGSALAGRIDQARAELTGRDLRVAVHFYLSDEWFTPDGIAAVAIPFYLAHPRLEKLEEAQMLEVEGGEYEWCMRILRHEIGHAVDNAYRLRLRRQRRAIFGSPAIEYPETYSPRPYSKSFVQHLDRWYAQSHPDEDFAETFAVWLTPNNQWQARYAGWPAAKKLEYLDALMTALKGKTPPVQNTTELDPLRRIRTTLRQHYRRKRRHYGVEPAGMHDRELRRLFSDAPEASGNITAAQFIARMRRPVRRAVAQWTGIYQYTIDQVIEEMIARCQHLKLRLALPEDQARQEFTVLLTVQVMNHMHGGGHRLVL